MQAVEKEKPEKSNALGGWPVLQKLLKPVVWQKQSERSKTDKTAWLLLPLAKKVRSQNEAKQLRSLVACKWREICVWGVGS